MAVLYAYHCELCLLEFTEFFAMRGAPVKTECPVCQTPSRRDFGSINVGTNDPIRRAILSSKLEQNLIEQNRPLLPDTPRDKFEAAHIGKAKGRIYIGDDTSALKPINQRAATRKREE